MTALTFSDTTPESGYRALISHRFHMSSEAPPPSAGISAAKKPAKIDRSDCRHRRHRHPKSLSRLTVWRKSSKMPSLGNKQHAVSKRALLSFRCYRFTTIKIAKDWERLRKTKKRGLTEPHDCAIMHRLYRAGYLGVAQLVARYLGVVEAAGSNPVTQTISSVHNGFELWTLDFFMTKSLFSFLGMYRSRFVCSFLYFYLSFSISFCLWYNISVALYRSNRYSQLCLFLL